MVLRANSKWARSADLVACLLHLEGRLEAASNVSSGLSSWKSCRGLAGDDAMIIHWGVMG